MPMTVYVAIIGSATDNLRRYKMYEFEKYVARHGEHGTQAIIEQMERTAGIRNNIEAPLPLEVRWHIVMDKPLPQQQRLAA